MSLHSVISIGEDKFDGAGVFSDITAVDVADALSHLLVQQVQAGCRGGACLSRHVRHVPGAGDAHRTQRILPRQRAHVQKNRIEILEHQVCGRRCGNKVGAFCPQNGVR